MKPGIVRPIAIGVFRHNHKILVAEGYDSVKKEIFYRPLGGTIEFGEPGEQTLRREMQEEIAAEVTNLRYLGAIENIFTFNGQQGHEIVLIYAGEFVDKAMYEQPSLMGQEDNGAKFKAVWKSLADFQDGQVPLYPTGLLEVLVNETNE
jgi:ADP-ribose pyrophosphatase YjhB (NUDIX family)